MWSPDRSGTPWLPDKIHWWVGRGLTLLAMINCFLGMKAKEWGAAPYVIVSLLMAGFAVACVVLQFTIGDVHRDSSGGGGVGGRGERDYIEIREQVCLSMRVTATLSLVVAILAIASGTPTRTYSSCRVVTEIGASYNYRLYWDTLTGASTSIKMAMEAEVDGWVGFGVGGSPLMSGIDTQVGMMTGGGAVVDGMSSGSVRPTADGTNDNTAVAVKNVGGVLTAEFDRVLNTGDGNDNVWLATGINSVVVAVGTGGTPTTTGSYGGHAARARFNLDFSVASSCPAPPSPPPPPPPALLDGLSCAVVGTQGMRVYWQPITGSDTAVTLGMSFPTATGWLGFGFVPGATSMANGDFAFGYLDGTNQMVLDTYRGAGSGVVSIDSTNDYTGVTVENSGGLLQAKFTRNLVTGDGQDRDIVAGNNLVAWAFNSDTNPSNPPVDGDYHTARGTTTLNFTATAVCPPPPPPPPPAATAQIDLTDAFTFSDGPFTMRFKVDTVNNRVSFALSKSGSAGYVAMCFTQSAGVMGPGDSYVAFASSAASGGYVVSDRQNPSGKSAPPADAKQDVLGVSGSETGGVMTVEFVRALDTGDNGDVVINDADINIVWAISDSATPGGGAGSATSGVSKHATTSTAAIKINFFTGKVSKDDLREKLIKAHAWMMIISWVVLIPVGIVVARFLKDKLGVWWFRVHRFTQWMAVLATFAAFGMAIWFTNEDFKGENKSHKLIGLAVVLVAFLEPVLGELSNLMWSPDRSGTPWFPDKIHWWVGRGLTLLAMINCFLGMKAKEWGAAPYVIVSLLVAGFAVACVVLQFTIGDVHHDAGNDKEMDDL
ncbi:uncharacterized protein AMSG_12462 [Thecamonas trahens ATCC 50062]|uniref:DOMON domain-containing protein n=1 Tax=Thecamonas trahens ATCC 50062 TaxID=461836 RepID=A0A0L0D2N6_THETB|nr:hypothetical protein AMSG_12462 [Thecamonas trahens ATCC 50062]KNC46471.1 hypothetical protein AMSG_12462 [Thecamonas trahens ATCC 50062]|eukprot:XP_013752603.1 hypothetical protein AMSG_12462 [Thecamonas trahens ATCC 50062]